jgi:quercetin dioxygenase-like cupin family protein
MNPRPIAEQLANQLRHEFNPRAHQRNVLHAPLVELHDEHGRTLPGIRGRAGAWGTTIDGKEFGADLIEMEPGSAFPLHTHDGDHLLYILRGTGYVHIDGRDRHVAVGDTIYIAANHAHGVKTDPQCTINFVLLAVGIPHKHISAHDRMHLADPADHPHEHPDG